MMGGMVVDWFYLTTENMENMEGTEAGGSFFDKILFHDSVFFVFSVVNLMVRFYCPQITQINTDFYENRF
jgi:hypothetical protein